MKVRSFIVALLLIAGFSSCSDSYEKYFPENLSDLPIVKKGTFPEEDKTLNIGENFLYEPEVYSPIDVYYQWYLGAKEKATEPTYLFTATTPGRFKVRLALSNDYGTVELENKIITPGADYSKGCFIVNEGWFGHESGNVSYYDYEAGTIRHWEFKNQNFGEELGITSQSATLWNGKMYICSKQDPQLVVVDPTTMYKEGSIKNITGNKYTHEFIGLNDSYGLITGIGYQYRVNLNTLATEPFSNMSIWYDGGSGIVYQDKLLLNLKNRKVYVFNLADVTGDLSQFNGSVPYTTLDINTTGGTRFVEGTDGNLYAVETNTDNTNNLVRIKPDFTIEKQAIRSDYSPSSFGAYREATFCGPTSDNSFFYIAGNKIYKCTFENAAPSTPFVDNIADGYSFYGAGIRVNPKDDRLVVTCLTADYSQNIVACFNASTGAKVSEIRYDGYYFPATISFN
ncbi:MAG: DUF5074 domain-containing protein [Prevotellaceae bacterium]|jgi:hypothetical protein|nr:DUF5074 domain-containing protein [Prevotellaceae bacterium]